MMYTFQSTVLAFRMLHVTIGLFDCVDLGTYRRYGTEREASNQCALISMLIDRFDDSGDPLR